MSLELPWSQIATLIATYRTARANQASNHWVLGDTAMALTKIAREVKYQFPDRDLIGDVLRQTGENRTSFLNHRWLARCFPPGPLRELNLSWTHFRLCAATADPEGWLRRAAEHRWTTRQLQQEIEALLEGPRFCDCGCGAEIQLDDMPFSLTGMSLGGKSFGFAHHPCVVKFLRRLDPPGDSNQSPTP